MSNQPITKKPVAEADKNDWRGKSRIKPSKFDDRLKSIFLNVYAETNRVMEALKIVEIDHGTLQYHLERDEEFAAGYEDAKRKYRDKIHRHATELMLQGTEVPIIGGKNKDQIVAKYKNYPIPLLQMELKRVDPDYKDRQEIDHKNGGGVVVIPNDVSADDWIKEQQKLNEKKQKPSDDFGTETKS